jgi:putative Mg2+ transporter-C (MgtC) family protein
LIGALIGYERRMHHKAIGVAGMVLIAIGSVTYILLARHLEHDRFKLNRSKI